MKPSLFIGSSVESLDVAYALQENLQRWAEVTVWDQGFFTPSSYILDGISKAIENTDFAAFVFAPDDTVAIREKEQTAVRDNVIFEMGLSIGTLGRERSFVLQPDGMVGFRFLSDLLGVTPVLFPMDREDRNFNAALGPAANKIRNTMQRLGRRKGSGPHVDGNPQVEAVSSFAARISESVDRLEEQAAAVSAITVSVEGILARLGEFTVPVVERAPPATDSVVERELPATVMQALRGPINQQIAKDVVQFVLSLKELDEHGDWAQEGYISYLGALLNNATHNADSLCRLSTKLQDGQLPYGGAEYRIDALSPAALTDIMLAEQIRRLPRLGKYSVVSNVGSWRGGQLSMLGAAIERAVKEQGVLIRRIFVIGDYAAHRYPATRREAREVLTRHLNASREWVGDSGSYQVKLLDGAAMRELGVRIPEAVQVIYEKHFGVFERPGATHCVRVEVTSPDLADLRIAGLDLGSKELRNFEVVWDALPPLTESLLEDALERWEEDRPNSV